MTITKTFYIEHQVGEDFVEYEYEVEADGYEPFVPAKVSGPPEQCYPAEGGCAEVNTGGTIKRRLTSLGHELLQVPATWERVPWSIFMEGLILLEDFTDDPAGKPFHKTALQKAEQYVEDEMTEACEEYYQGRYEDAMEARAEARAERDWD